MDGVFEKLPVSCTDERSVLKKSSQGMVMPLITLFLPKNRSIPEVALLELRLMEHQQRVFQQVQRFSAEPSTQKSVQCGQFWLIVVKIYFTKGNLVRVTRYVAAHRRHVGSRPDRVDRCRAAGTRANEAVVSPLNEGGWP